MKNVFIGFLAALLMACGTTSELRNNGQPENKLSLAEYSSVVILDFGDGTPNKNLPAYAGRNFAERIASQVRGTGVFAKVLREKTDDKSIVLSGNITRYEEGNATMRMLIGFGAGSSYFDALVKFHDSITGEEIGEIIVDKNSWALGGGIASGQTVDLFMNEAAEKIANELVEAKQPGQQASR